jgi:O-Antigen ligase
VSAAVKSIIVAIIGLIFAVALGSQLGHGSWLVPAGVAGGCVLFATYVVFFRSVRLEALILGFLIFGYIVGNRGFAQISLTEHPPLYLGEVGMLACLAGLGFNFALKRDKPLPKSALSWAILAFIAIGAIRLYFDLVLHLNLAEPKVIVRDSAAVYYAFFFFIAFKLARNPVARQVVERSVLMGCILLIPVFIIQFFVAPNFFNHFTFRGYPVILHKGDLTTTYLAFASFFFFLRPARGILHVLFRVLALIFFAGMLALMARAALFGFAVASVLLLVARRAKFIVYQAAIGCLVLIVVGLLQLSQLNEGSGFLSRLTDRVESMADISGTGNYRSSVGDSSASNNQFRTVWWTTVFNETMQRGPWFGLGFGYDLTAGFLRAYFPTGGEDTATTRSPHSIWVTIFGRMGVIGLLSFSAVVFFMFRDAFRGARLVARGRQPTETLVNWCAVMIILGSASFGVVLEGPMGGILFWSFLGLASSRLQQYELAEETKARDQEPSEPSGVERNRPLVPV